MDRAFDDLTRSFGTPMSRRRALALFAATAVGAALGLRPKQASAGHCGTERVCEVRKVDGEDVKACWRPFGGKQNPSEDCKCKPGSPGKGEACIDARPHCGSSDNPCPGGVPPECKCRS